MLASSAGKAGFATLPPGVHAADYEKLVIAEIKGFAGLDFVDELEAIQARMLGRSEVETAMQEQLTGLGKTSPVDRESLRDVLAELRPNAVPAAEVTHYPGLVDAFGAAFSMIFGGGAPTDRRPTTSRGHRSVPCRPTPSSHRSATSSPASAAGWCLDSPLNAGR